MTIYKCAAVPVPPPPCLLNLGTTLTHKCALHINLVEFSYLIHTLFLLFLGIWFFSIVGCLVSIVN